MKQILDALSASSYRYNLLASLGLGKRTHRPMPKEQSQKKLWKIRRRRNMGKQK